MIQQQFAESARQILEPDSNVIGLAVTGSWLTTEIDEFSDLDLILVTKEKVSHDKNKMLHYAGQIGKLISGFTGEHVGEPRLLICLYDHPLLHVDIKFLTPDEFQMQGKKTVLLMDKGDQLKATSKNPEATFPYPDYQWIEDRFWTWIHYVLQKIGRGEYLEAFDSFSDLRRMVLGPLLHLKNKNRPRGVRKVEKELSDKDLERLLRTLPQYNKQALLLALRNVVVLYDELRAILYDDTIILQKKAELKVMLYFEQMEERKS